jgi:membrane fusion protein (multidrug efflux system)
VLLPGQFVRARIEAGLRANTFLIPQRAVRLAAGGASVFIVDGEDKVAVRPVKTGALRGSDWMVTEGLQAGDRVIVDGLQKIQPGMTVRTTQTERATNREIEVDPAPATR